MISLFILSIHIPFFLRANKKRLSSRFRTDPDGMTAADDTSLGLLCKSTFDFCFQFILGFFRLELLPEGFIIFHAGFNRIL